MELKNAAANSKQEILLEAFSSLVGASTLDAISDVVKKAARKVVNSDGVTFVLREKELCHYFDEEAISPLWKSQKFPMRMCISGWVMLNGCPAVIEDVFKDPRIPIEAYQPTFVKSLAMIPVRTSSPTAAIGVYWKEKYKTTDEQIEILQQLADCVSVSMENVLLRGQLEKKVRDLEQASKEKDEFLMTLSHELRTPLHSILGWAQLLEDTQVSWDEVREGMEVIKRNANAQVRLIDDLLNASRIVMGRSTLSKENVEPSVLFQASVSSATPIALRKNISLETAFNSSFGIVSVDSEKMKQVFDNLLSNAIKFTPPGGRIVAKLYREGPSCCFVVEDTGEGISAEFLPFVFDRFRQADSSTTRQHGGLGLGLAIAKSLVEAHFGSITVSSPGKGKGCRFEVRLPLEQILELRSSQTLTLARPQAQKTALTGLKVLVVDDDPDGLFLVSAILKRYGAVVQTAASVSDGLEKFVCMKPDLCISDLSMPIEDGFDFLEKLRSEVHALTPVIALTAFADKEHRSKANAAGFSDFLEKPLVISKLLDAAERIFGRTATNVSRA